MGSINPEVSRMGNVEYKVINSISRGGNYSIYGSNTIEIEVVNGASKEDVLAAFDTPMSDVFTMGDNRYSITFYRD